MFILRVLHNHVSLQYQGESLAYLRALGALHDGA